MWQLDYDKEKISMKKWLIPIVYSLISPIAFLLSGAIGVLGNNGNTGYGGSVIVFCCLTVYCVLAVPIMCFSYSKQHLPRQKFVFFFTVYLSFLMALPFYIYSLLTTVSIYIPLIFFGWCQIWASLGLAKFTGRADKQ